MWNPKLFRNVLIHEVEKECDRNLEDYFESSLKVTRTRKYEALLRSKDVRISRRAAP